MAIITVSHLGKPRPRVVKVTWRKCCVQDLNLSVMGFKMGDLSSHWPKLCCALVFKNAFHSRNYTADRNCEWLLKIRAVLWGQLQNCWGDFRCSLEKRGIYWEQKYCTIFFPERDQIISLLKMAWSMCNTSHNRCYLHLFALKNFKKYDDFVHYRTWGLIFLSYSNGHSPNYWNVLEILFARLFGAI